MSVALMGIAFRAAVPATQKLVLLALCDSANDQGECYPSVPTLCAKSSLSERAVQSAITTLEAAGFLRREFRTGRSTVYWCTPAAGAPPQNMHPAPHAPTPARRAPPPPQLVHPTPAPPAPITIKEPSIEPSPKQKAPSVPDVSAGVLADWQQLRKAKKAPVTQTALDGVRREALKAGLTMQQALEICCQRGWTGFKADWVQEAPRGAVVQPITAPSGGAVAQTANLLAEQAAAAERARSPEAQAARQAAMARLKGGTR